MAWPRPVVLVDADPSGAKAIQAGYFRGGAMPTDATIVDLAVAHRQGNLATELPELLIDIPNSNVALLCGLTRHNQARALDGVWEPLAETLKSLERNGQDVIVDAGRLGLEGWPRTLIAAADLALLTTRSTLPALVAAAAWSVTLTELFTRSGGSSALAGLLIGQGMPYRVDEVAKVLGFPVVTSLAWDPTSAEVFSLGAAPPRKFQSANLPKSLRAGVNAIQSTLAASAVPAAEGSLR